MSKLSKRPQNNPINNVNYFDSCKEYVKNKSLKNKEFYSKNVKSCLECNKIFDYKERKKKFCNSSCAAKFNNRKRSKESRIKQQKTIIDNLESANKRKLLGRICFVTFIECKICKSLMRQKSGSHLYCKSCVKNNIKLYRRACRFTFTESEYPEKFDKELINTYGWYKPSNSKNPNLTGVTWDHIIPIHKGFELGIDPETMKHPNNARLMLWRDNLRRYLNSE